MCAVVRWVLAVVAGVLLAGHASSADAGEGAVALRLGTTLGDDGFRSQELEWRAGLWRRFTADNGWSARFKGGAHAGRVAVDGERLVMAGGLFGLRLAPPQGPFTITVGTGPVRMSRSTLGGRDFGGPWQFTSWAGVELALAASVAVGYRVQHTSNAGLHRPNPGFDLQTLELRVRY